MDLNCNLFELIQIIRLTEMLLTEDVAWVEKEKLKSFAEKAFWNQ